MQKLKTGYYNHFHWVLGIVSAPQPRTQTLKPLRVEPWPAQVLIPLAPHKKSPTFVELLFPVEPEGFEPTSKHSMIYAFYMLSFSLIVGRGKVSRLPIPFSVSAVSRQGLAESP